MDQSDFSVNTPKVLKQCSELFLSPKYESYPVPLEVNVDKFSDHPDIQYFKRIKSKNHYNYHKFKRTPKKTAQTAGLTTDFDPYSRDLLISRISTFSALNWSVPECVSETINELKCCQNGWKCVSISVQNNTKNHLLCTSCKRFLTLLFNEFGSDPPSNLDLKDYDHLNTHLANEYLSQITVTGHDLNCPWRNFETPTKGVYYMPPFIEQTDEVLRTGYLKGLKSLVENSVRLCDKVDSFPSVVEAANNLQDMSKLITVSNESLLDEYYHYDKENQSEVLAKVPNWIYLLALLGWTLKVQSFSNHLVLFLVCGDCNKKVFMDALDHPMINNETKPMLFTGLDVSSSSILTPVKYPPMLAPIRHSSLYDAIIEEEEEEEEIVVMGEHKSWCLRNVDWCNKETVSQYVLNLLCNNEERMVVDDGKRKATFDINDGLERLNKLRKLYLVDD